MIENIKEHFLNLCSGLYTFAWIGIIMFSYIWSISYFDFSETTEEILIFGPLFIYAAYMMGSLKRINKQ